jgi:hypothetical protein
VPIGIELAHSTRQAPVVYTPADPASVWQLAKALLMSVDTAWHQVISHFLRTHASVEPFLIATRRRLPPTHPVSDLRWHGLHLILKPNVLHVGMVYTEPLTLVPLTHTPSESCVWARFTMNPGP